MGTEPTTTIPIVTILLNIIPVIIGGLIATTGAFAGAFLTYQLNQTATKSKIKREKLEQLANAAYRTIHWLEENRNVNLFDKNKDIGLSPISEVEYLSKLYIPELKKEVASMSVAFSNMNVFIAESNVFKVTNKNLPKDFIEKLKPLHEELLLTVTKLLEKASIVAEEL